MAQKIYYPDDLERADFMAAVNKERFMNAINSENPQKILTVLQNLPDFLKNKLENAKNNNLPRRRRELVEIREIALNWYNLNYIKDPTCNFRLNAIKEELKWFIAETKISYQPKAKKAISESNLIPNDLNYKEIYSKIETYLLIFKSEQKIEEPDYGQLVIALTDYFVNGQFPLLSKPIKFSKINKKRLGWSLNLIFRACKSDNEKISIEYLRFAKKYISVFLKTEFNEERFTRSTLYKYFTTKI